LHEKKKIIFRYTNLVNINKEREKEDISIEVTVKVKDKVTKYGLDGHRLTGLFEDGSDKIDFICWKDMVNYVDANLQQGNTYIVKNIRIKRCSKMYTKTSKDVQLLFTNNTTISRSEMGPLHCPIQLTKILYLKLADVDKANVAG
jgi:DNA polymerase III alpha subunit